MNTLNKPTMQPYPNAYRMPRARLLEPKPRGRMSAYAFFVQTCREEHKITHPEKNVVFAEFSRSCADRWKVMDDQEKKRFFDSAEKDKVRYDSEMAGYRGPKGFRGRRRRQRKDPNAPKRALSAFFWFCSSERSKVREINPTMGVGEVAKQLGLRWSAVSPDVRTKCDELARQDKARYVEEMKAFKGGRNFAPKQENAMAVAAAAAAASGNGPALPAAAGGSMVLPTPAAQPHMMMQQQQMAQQMAPYGGYGMPGMMPQHQSAEDDDEVSEEDDEEEDE